MVGSMQDNAQHRCQVCGGAKRLREMVPASLVRPNIAELIIARVPGWNAESYICISCLNRFRTDFVREQMEKEQGELSALEHEVVQSIRDNELIADNINRDFDKNLTFGQRLADKVAEFGGSWTFIIIFFSVMGIWIAINSAVLLWRPFDPYPFILFNLVLSMLAAIQAPIIMMSQNRQEVRDRLRAENDYKVNLKAEIEIRAIGEKLDQLLHNQWIRLLEIQQIQMEMLEDLSGKRDR
jgi:uncharacterized membrane protein